MSLERPGYLELQAFHQRLEDLGRLPLHGLPAITLLDEFSDDYNKFFYCDGVVGVLVINSLEKVRKSLMIKDDEIFYTIIIRKKVVHYTTLETRPF